MSYALMGGAIVEPNGRLRRIPLFMWRTLPLLLLAATACTGEIGNALQAKTQATDDTCAGVTYSDTAPLRRLSQTELTNTLTALASELGATSFDPGTSPLPDPTEGDFFSNNAAQNSVSQYTSEQLVDMAERVSDQLVTDANAFTGCTLGSAADACVQEFITRYGRIALQRPLEDDEVTALASVYEAVTASDSSRSGVRAIVEASLQSPTFLYITSTTTQEADGRLRFDGHTVARRLSYFLWGSMPDATLRAAADAGALSTTDELRIQVERMIDDPRARDTLRRFHREWLAVQDTATLAKDPEVFPNYSAELGADMDHEFDAFVDEIVWTQSGSIAQLLTDRSAIVNKRLAEFYGVESPSVDNDDWQAVTLPENRRGVTTRAAYLAANGTETGTSPIRRGVAVLSKLMCVSLVAPSDVDITLPTPDPDGPTLTKKELFAQHDANPSCQACHVQIDPLGFAFEIYDATGAFETTYSDGQPVDATGTTSDGRTFTDATDLIDQLANDSQIAQCYSQKWLEWSVGRSATREEKCAIAAIAQTSATSVRDAIVQLATSDLMLYETPGAVQ